MTINQSLPPGLAADTAAVLGISLGCGNKEIVSDGKSFTRLTSALGLYR